MKGFFSTLAITALCVGSAASLDAQSFGNALAVAGGQILVGEPVYEMRSGVVYVFQRDAAGQWVKAQRLEPAGATPGNRFGIRLAAQDDLLLVSATRVDGGTGAVYMYRNQNGTWSESGRLVTDDRTPADSLGSGLAIDGDWVAVGTIAQNGARGAAYTFRRNGDRWIQHSKLAPAGLQPEDRFGDHIAIDGDNMLISAGNAGGGQGAVYAYRYDSVSDAWMETGELQAPLLNEQSGFGASAAIVGDIALVGAPGLLAGVGSVIAYALDEGQWQLSSLLIPFEAASATGFGNAIEFDGRNAMFGAGGSGFGEGRVFAYTLDPETLEWTASTQITAGAPENAFFGGEIAMGSDFLVGAAPGAARQTGAAWVLQRDAGGWSPAGRIDGDVLGIDAVAGDEVTCSDQGTAAGFECSSVDLLSFLPLNDMQGGRGVRTNDVWGWTEPGTGREIVLVGMTDQTAFVDITNPGRPTYLGRLPMPPGAQASVWRDMKVYRDHMFVVSDNAAEHGMQVFDLTHLTGLDGSAPVTFEADARYDRIASAHNIVINEETGFAYSVGSSGGGETCGGGLHMINIQDPKNPTFAGCFQDMTTGRQRTGYSHDAQCVIYRGPDQDYAGREICLGSNETALSIADVTDKSSPVAVAMATYPNVGYSHQGWLSEDHRYFFMGDELDETGGNVATTRTLIWDLADLDDPVLAKEYMADTKVTDHNLYIVGNTMYQSNYKAGLRILDVSDPENPVPVGNFDTVPYGGDDPQMTGSWSNYPYFRSGVIAVTSGAEGLFLVRYRPRTISE